MLSPCPAKPPAETETAPARSAGSHILADPSSGLPSPALGSVIGWLPCAGVSSVIERPKSFANASLLKCELALGSNVVAVSDKNEPVNCVVLAGSGSSCFVPVSPPLRVHIAVLYVLSLIMTYVLAAQTAAARWEKGELVVTVPVRFCRLGSKYPL